MILRLSADSSIPSPDFRDFKKSNKQFDEFAQLLDKVTQTDSEKGVVELTGDEKSQRVQFMAKFVLQFKRRGLALCMVRVKQFFAAWVNKDNKYKRFLDGLENLSTTVSEKINKDIIQIEVKSNKQSLEKILDICNSGAVIYDMKMLKANLIKFQTTLQQSAKEEACPEEVLQAFRELPDNLKKALAKAYAQVSLYEKSQHDIESAVFADPRLLLDLKTPKGSIFSVIDTSLEKNIKRAGQILSLSLLTEKLDHTNSLKNSEEKERNEIDLEIGTLRSVITDKVMCKKIDEIFENPSSRVRVKRLRNYLHSLKENPFEVVAQKVKRVGEKTKAALGDIGATQIDEVKNNLTSPDVIKKPIRAVMVSAECSHLANVGGLAEVVYSLPFGILEDNPDSKVRLIFPDYDTLPDAVRKGAVNKTSKYGFFNGGGNGCEVYKAKLMVEDKNAVDPTKAKKEIKVYFVKPAGIGEDIFKLKKAAAATNVANPNVYCGTTEKIHERFIGFTSLAAEVAYKMQQKENKMDVLHLHDWHAAGVGKVLAKRYKEDYLKGKIPPIVFTYHNNQYGAQGVINSKDAVNAMKKFGVKDTGTNFLLDGMNFADMITTVSPHFAVEAQTAEKGEGIDKYMRREAAHGRMVGIINGANPHDFNPQTNAQLKSWKLDITDPNEVPVDLTYGPNDLDILEKKQFIAQKLKAYFEKFHPTFNFDPSKPLVTFVGRLNASQKGVEMFKIMAEEVERAGGQFLIMGSQEDAEGTRLLDELVKAMPNLPVIRDKKVNNRYEIQQGTEQRSGIGALVRAATSYMAIPSSFEPCGLVQFEGWLYGAQALGARTGGLVSSINEEGPYMNGYLFERDREDLRKTLEKAFAADKARTPDEQRELAKRLIEQGRQYGWATAPEGKDSPVAEYRMVYEQARKNALNERNGARVNLMLA